jgi:broad specificity phosphatase PhoE
MSCRAAVLGVLLVLSAATALAQKAVFVARHGEKFSEEDERLTDAGKARAHRLASMLKDSGVAAVYSTDTERTIGTAKPLADRLGQKVRIYPNPSALSETLRRDNAADVVLVVGHSNSVPALLEALGCTEKVSIAGDEYDNLFVVVPAKDAKPTLLRLRY